MPRPKVKTPELGTLIKVHALLKRGGDESQSFEDIRAGRRRVLWEPEQLRKPLIGFFVGLRAVRDTERVPGYRDGLFDGGEGPSHKVLRAHPTWLVAFKAREKHYHARPEDCEVLL